MRHIEGTYKYNIKWFSKDLKPCSHQAKTLSAHKKIERRRKV